MTLDECESIFSSYFTKWIERNENTHNIKHTKKMIEQPGG